MPRTPLNQVLTVELARMGWSKARFARTRIGVRPQSLNDVLQAETPTDYQLNRIAAGLGISLKALKIAMRAQPREE